MIEDKRLSETQEIRLIGRRAGDMMKFWPVVVALIIAVMSYGELRFQVHQNNEDIAEIKVKYSRQWDKFGSHDHE